MAGDRYTHTSYIRTTPEALWEALTDADVARTY